MSEEAIYKLHRYPSGELEEFEYVQELVRCKECRWGKPYSDKQLECDAPGLGGLKFPDDFCSYGSRSEKPNNSKVSEIPTGSERSSE